MFKVVKLEESEDSPKAGSGGPRPPLAEVMDQEEPSG